MHFDLQSCHELELMWCTVTGYLISCHMNSTYKRVDSSGQCITKIYCSFHHMTCQWIDARLLWYFNGKSWCFKSPTIRLRFFPSASVSWHKIKKKHVWYYWSSMRIWWREGIPHKGLWWWKRLLVITLSCRSLTRCILVTQYSCIDLGSALLSWWFVAWRHRHDLM